MYERELEVAKEAAMAAGRFLREQCCYDIDSENGRDIKLSVDRESENIIIDILSKTGYSILSEETGIIENNTELNWIVDPLDGTMNYKNNIRELTCVSIALYKGYEPLLGVVYRYMMDELYVGIIGKHAQLNDTIIKPSKVLNVSKAVLGTGFPVRRDYDNNSISSFIANAQHFKKVRMLGTAAIMATFVACGRLEVYMEDNVMLWDIAAAVAIVEAAGGCVDLEVMEGNKCLCRCFANSILRDEYNGKRLG